MERSELEGPDIDLSATDKHILRGSLINEEELYDTIKIKLSTRFFWDLCDSQEYLPCSIN